MFHDNTHVTGPPKNKTKKKAVPEPDKSRTKSLKQGASNQTRPPGHGMLYALVGKSATRMTLKQENRTKDECICLECI